VCAKQHSERRLDIVGLAPEFGDHDAYARHLALATTNLLLGLLQPLAHHRAVHGRSHIPPNR
jgi:hypothetical protein